MLSKGTNVISCNFAKTTNVSDQSVCGLIPEVQNKKKINHTMSHSGLMNTLLSAAVLMHLCCCCVHVCSEDVFSSREFT